MRGAVPVSCTQGLSWVGSGPVASVVGRLRQDVVGVDIDADGPVGDLLVDALRDWCAARGLWHLARPSGGGPGRWHLFIIPGVHRAALTAFVAAARADRRLSRRILDIRGQLRALQAPHRRTGQIPTVPGAAAALVALPRHLEALPERVSATRAAAAGYPDDDQVAGPARAARGGPSAALTPLPRAGRVLPGPWAAYLTHGRTAVMDAGLDVEPGTRSGVELVATFQLVITGHTEPQAWEAICTAHRAAFTKARHNGRRWWWLVWNRAVLDADAWLSQRRAERPPTRITGPRGESGATTGSSPASPTQPTPRAPLGPLGALGATAAARAAMDTEWTRWGPRSRHTDREVLTCVLDRMDRVGATAVALPQRDLMLDAAICSRTTARAALARLSAAGYLRIEATYVPGTVDTAHTVHLADRFSQRDAATSRDVLGAEPLHQHAASEALSQLDPTKNQPPQRGSLGQIPPERILPVSLRRNLGLLSARVYAVLPDLATKEGLPEDQIVIRAGMINNGCDPTDRQLRTVRGHLRKLAGHGLIQADAHGHWQAVDPNLVPVVVPEQVQAAADAGHAKVVDNVRAEREAFRSVVDPAARRADWEHRHARAIAASAKARRAAQRAWWDLMDPTERAERSQARATAFHDASPAQQAENKQRWAVARAGAGDNERARYDTWLASLAPGELEERSAGRALAYAGRPRYDQLALVSAWGEHRARWDLPHPQRPPTAATGAAAPPAGADPARADPAAPLMRRATPTTTELALLDRDGQVPPAVTGTG